jgi:hypothetical protein
MKFEKGTTYKSKRKHPIFRNKPQQRCRNLYQHPKSDKDIQCSWIQVFQTGRMYILSKFIYKFHAIPTKITVSVFCAN